MKTLMTIFTIICLVFSAEMWRLSVKIKLCNGLSSYFLLCFMAYAWLTLVFTLPRGVLLTTEGSFDTAAAWFLGFMAIGFIAAGANLWKARDKLYRAVGPHTSKDDDG